MKRPPPDLLVGLFRDGTIGALLLLLLLLWGIVRQANIPDPPS